MLHIIAGEESAAYDGALFAIFSHISFFDRRTGFSACRTGRGNKERNDNYMWRCSSFSLMCLQEVPERKHATRGEVIE